jgi:cardiolipin synthase
MVPVVVWAIAAGEMKIACLVFLLAGLSDLIDGFLAKRFNMATELGAYLDPLADKAMIVSIYVTLASTGVIPLWIVILVVSRDIMIVGAIILSWLIGNPIAIRPHMVSKANTAAQIIYACLVLALYGFGFGRLVKYSADVVPFAGLVIRGCACAALIPLLRGGDLPGIYAWFGMSFWPVILIFWWHRKDLLRRAVSSHQIPVAT